MYFKNENVCECRSFINFLKNHLFSSMGYETMLLLKYSSKINDIESLSVSLPLDLLLPPTCPACFRHCCPNSYNLSLEGPKDGLETLHFSQIHTPLALKMNDASDKKGCNKRLVTEVP